MSCIRSAIWACLVSTLLIGCASLPKVNEYEDQNSSQSASISGFSLEEIGVNSVVELPAGIQVYYPTKYTQSIEPAIFDTIGQKMENITLEEFCKRSSSIYPIIITDCKISESLTPYAEFYLAQFNPYNDNYTFIGKYVLFKTFSKIRPALLFMVPLSEDLTSEEAVKTFFAERSQQEQISERTLSEFAQTISIKKFHGEAEWLTHTDEKNGFEIKYPNGLNVYSWGGANVFSIGPDGQFMINYYKTRPELNEFLISYWDHREKRTMEKNIVDLGRHDAEKISIIISPESGGIDKKDIYVVTAKSGFFAIFYAETYEESFTEMLETFELSESQKK